MNLAIEQDLFRYAEYGTTIVYIWQNKNTIVIGKNQNVFSECKADEFVREGGKIARRMSGGGAVYHDDGNLNYSLINIEDDTEKREYWEVIQKMMKSIDLECCYNGRNDLMLNGRKFSGNAFYDNGEVLCQHGTILVDADINRMNYLLTPDSNKLERNRVRSVASRVINLSECVDGITVEEMKLSLIRAIESECINYAPDQSHIAELYDLFSSEKWIYGET